MYTVHLQLLLTVQSSKAFIHQSRKLDFISQEYCTSSSRGTETHPDLGGSFAKWTVIPSQPYLLPLTILLVNALIHILQVNSVSTDTDLIDFNHRGGIINIFPSMSSIPKHRVAQAYYLYVLIIKLSFRRHPQSSYYFSDLNLYSLRFMCTYMYVVMYYMYTFSSVLLASQGESESKL